MKLIPAPLRLPFAVLFCATLFVSCKSVPMPKGTAKGYSTARFVKLKPGIEHDLAEPSVDLNQMVKHAVAMTFEENGISVHQSEGELMLGFLILSQDKVSTTRIDTYFGYKDDAGKIQSHAHKMGVVKNESRNPDFTLGKGAVVIDVVDAKTQRLIFRNYAVRDLVGDLTEQERLSRIEEAVAEALNPFFRKR